MADIQDLSPVDADNTGRWPENMKYQNVNDAGRADEGLIARWYKDIDGSIVASGESNAFAASSNRTISALVDNTVLVFTANHSITGAATLDLNGLGAKDIRRFNGQALAAGDIISGQPIAVHYKAALDYFFMTTVPAALTANMYSDFSEGTPTAPAADTARVYAKAVGDATVLAYKDADGVERILRGADEAVGALLDILEDHKSANTDPQSGPGNSWAARHLNTEVFDRLGILSLASNRFTIGAAGTYEIGWESPFYGSSAKTRCFNVTDSAEVALGTQGKWKGGTGNTMYYSTGLARVTITDAKAFEIQMYGNADGGVATNSDGKAEIYTRVVIRRG